MVKTWNLKVNEEELKALIEHHARKMAYSDAAAIVSNPTVETSSRIHDLTKRLNKTDAEITKEETPAAEEKKVDPWS